MESSRAATADAEAPPAWTSAGASIAAMTRRYLLPLSCAGLALIASCEMNERRRSSDTRTGEPMPPTSQSQAAPAALVDHPGACASQVAELRRWLAVLEREGEASPEYLPRPDRAFVRPIPAIPLVRTQERAAPLASAAIVALHLGNVRFEDLTAPVRKTDRLLDVMSHAVQSLLSQRPSSEHTEPRHPFVVLIGEDETWSDIVRLIDAAARLRFTHADFVFAVDSDLPRPVATGRASAMLALGNDGHERPYLLEDKERALLAESNRDCPGVAATLNVPPDQDVRPSFVKGAADAVDACACRADIDAIKMFAWVRYGRQWGGLMASYPVAILTRAAAKAHPERPAEVLSAAPDVRWREVSKLVTEASRRNVTTVFVSPDQ